MQSLQCRPVPLLARGANSAVPLPASRARTVIYCGFQEVADQARALLKLLAGFERLEAGFGALTKTVGNFRNYAGLAAEDAVRSKLLDRREVSAAEASPYTIEAASDVLTLLSAFPATSAVNQNALLSWAAALVEEV